MGMDACTCEMSTLTTTQGEVMYLNYDNFKLSENFFQLHQLWICYIYIYTIKKV
jgi:hypothetical protein